MGDFQDYQTQLLANRGAVSLASKETQEIFQGAFVIAPQVRDTWYNNYKNGYIQVIADLVETQIKSNKNIDSERIYIVGASAGGFMTWHMLINHKELFSGAIIICPALDIAASKGVPTTKEQIESVKNIPIWIVHSKNDQIVSSKETSKWTYELLKEEGVIYSEYENVIINNIEYNGHFSWIYVSNNLPNNDGLSIFEWLVKQNK